MRTHVRHERVADIHRPTSKRSCKKRKKGEPAVAVDSAHEKRVENLATMFATGELRAREAIRLVDRGQSHRNAARDVGWSVEKLREVCAALGLVLPEEKPGVHRKRLKKQAG